MSDPQPVVMCGPSRSDTQRRHQTRRLHHATREAMVQNFTLDDLRTHLNSRTKGHAE